MFVIAHTLYLIILYLEIDSDIEVEAGVTGFLKIIMADIGKTELVGHLCIQHIVFHSTSKAKTAIETLEIRVRESGF